MTDSANRRSGWITAGLTGLFFAAVFVLLYRIIDVRLIYIAQEPPFFKDSAFLFKHLHYPGGLSDYAGSFLTQLMFYGWPGALSMTLLIGTVCLMTAGIMTRFRKILPILMCVPASLLLVLHSYYRFPVSSTAALAMALIAVWLYFRFDTQPVLLRLTVFLLISVPLYMAAGALFFLFVLLVIIHDIFKAEQKWTAVFYAFTAWVLPFLSYRFLFIISARQAFTNQLPTEFHNPHVLPGLLVLAFFPLMYVAISGYRQGSNA